MSFFNHDATAKEQLPGAVGSAITVPPAPPAIVQAYIPRRVKRRPPLDIDLLLALEAYLQMKSNAT